MSGNNNDSRRTCEDLMIQSYRFVDEGHASQATELFSADGRFTITGGVEIAGTGSLAEFFAAREADKDRRTRHCLTNLTFAQLSENEAQVRATLMLFVLSDGGTTTPSGLADVEDRYRLEGADWRIASRTTTPL